MAYPSQQRSSRGASSRGPSRGGGRGSSRGGGGGTNTMAYGVAAVLVILVIVLFMSFSEKKPKPTPTPVSGPAVEIVRSSDPTPAAAPTKPFPPLSNAVLERGRALATTFDADAKRADGLFEEGRQAKARDDQAVWQSKMKEAIRLYDSIKSRWNEFVNGLPTGNGYETEDVARHYFARENGLVAKLTKNLSATKTDLK